MSRLDLLYERNDTFLDHLSIRIREGIENESIDIRIAKHISKVRLHLAVSAAAQIENLQACITHKLRRVTHAGTACADSVSEAGSEDTDTVTERRLQTLYHGSLLDSDLDRVKFAVDREVEHALLHAIVHILQHDEFLALPGIINGVASRVSIKPFSIFLYIEVETSGSHSHCRIVVIHICIISLDRYCR